MLGFNYIIAFGIKADIKCLLNKNRILQNWD